METISMSRRERHRLEAFSRVRREEITLVKASELLGLSYRQTKRCYARYQKEGDKGLVHRLRGQPSNRQADARQKRRILSLYEKKYADYGPTLAAECLRDEDGVTARVETLRQWLSSAGLWRKRRRASPIGNVGLGRSTLANWCRWTVRITTGLKAVATGRC